MQDGNLNKELANALARLQSSFEALGNTRDLLGGTLEVALDECTRQINDLDAKLSVDCRYRHRG